MYFDIKTLKNSAEIEKIAGTADKLGTKAFLVGGFVRDLLLKRESKDIDIVTEGNGITLAQKSASAINHRIKVNIFKTFGTAQFKYHDCEFEFVGARKESYQQDSRKPFVEKGSIEDDQKRRDFTINALAISLNKENLGELIDPFEGVSDIKQKIIRTPLDPDITFSDDPLRMLRAIRFSTQLSFRIEDKTLDAIKRNSQRITIISKERVVDELNKIILSSKPSIGFKLLEKTELLKHIFPELLRLKGRDVKNGVGHKDNFYHTLEVLDRIVPYTNNLWLRWSALLHDIAKPLTKKFTQNAWTFHGHNHIGAKIIPKIFRKMHMPLNEKMKFVQKMVNLHMRPIVLSEEEVSDSAVRRLLFEAGDDIDDLMTLCEADITSKNEEKQKLYLKNFQLVRKKLRDLEERDSIRNFQPPISGEVIMETFNLPPSKEVGLIKDAIKEAILDGKIANNYEEAFQFMLKTAMEMGIEPHSES